MKSLYKTIGDKKMEVDDDGIVFVESGRVKGIFTWEEIVEVLSERINNAK